MKTLRNTLFRPLSLQEFQLLEPSKSNYWNYYWWARSLGSYASRTEHLFHLSFVQQQRNTNYAYEYRLWEKVYAPTTIVSPGAIRTI